MLFFFLRVRVIVLYQSVSLEEREYYSCLADFLFFLNGQIYTDWANHYLAKSGHKRLIRDLQQDIADGVLLAEIIQVVGKKEKV